MALPLSEGSLKDLDLDGAVEMDGGPGGGGGSCCQVLSSCVCSKVEST